MKDIAPYSTFIVLDLQTSATATAVKEIADKIFNLLSARQSTKPAVGRVVHSFSPDARQGKGHAIYTEGFVLREKRENSWDLVSSYTDTLHHLCLVSASRQLILIHTSDTNVRTQIERVIRSSASAGNPWCACLTRNPLVAPEVIETAFFERAKLKALWMAGGHRSTAVKPTSKILNGTDLEYALDALADQSYIASAARAEQIDGTSFGVTPRRAAIWRGPNTSFDRYCEEVADIVSMLSDAKSGLLSGTKQPAEIPVLMRSETDWSKVSQAYDFDLADVESLVSSADRKIVEQIQQRYTFDFEGPTSDQRFALSVSTVGQGSRTTTVEIEPGSDATGRSLSFKVVQPSAVPSEFAELCSALSFHPRVWRGWYDSGHSIADATLVKLQTRDTTFDGWCWIPFNSASQGSVSFAVKQEKPTQWANLINQPAEESLFSWCVKNVSGLLGQPVLGVTGQPLPPLAPNGNTWLYCDDGSREVADFVYVHQGNQSIIALVHVKGAGKDGTRRVVPSPYELVSAQAMKNIRDLEAGRLVERITARVNNNGASRIWNAPWRVNQSPTGNSVQFLAALNAVQANTRYLVIVVQPHVQKLKYFKRVGRTFVPTEGVAQAQLRTLLHGVKSAAAAVNAEFYVVSDDS